MGKVSTCEIQVRYAETDKMGVAHHSSYLLWFELARTGLLKEAGCSYRDMESGGALLPVVEYNCRFRIGAEYDDTLNVVTHMTEIRSRALTFNYRVLRGDELLAEGWTRHICVDGDNRPRRVPDATIEGHHALQSGGLTAHQHFAIRG